jgi:hypothetical protein
MLMSGAITTISCGFRLGCAEEREKLIMQHFHLAHRLWQEWN